jgi:hypothetical protein
LCSLSIGSRAGHDQRLLVGEQQPLAGARRGECRAQTRGADDRRHHACDFRQHRQLFESLGTGEQARPRSAAPEQLAQLAGRSG